jgi:hypothetical protein
MAFNGTLLDLTHDVNNIVNKTIVEGYDHGHNEDGITIEILKNFRKKFEQAEITDLAIPTKLLCGAYKYTKKYKLEQRFGDIAVLVKIHYKDKSTLEGIGFLEAKKREEATGRFGAFKIKQIKRIYNNAPNSFVLTYDYKPANNQSKDIDLTLRDNSKAFLLNRDSIVAIPLGSPLVTSAVVIPNNIILREKKLKVSLYRNAIPFCYQLCYRFLLGFDLNFTESTVKPAKNFIDNLRCEHIMVFDVLQGDIQTDNLASNSFRNNTDYTNISELQ